MAIVQEFNVAEPKRRRVNTYLDVWGFGSMPFLTAPAKKSLTNPHKSPQP